jgi:diguanylate cyclase (GGDEF)-like protein
MSPGRWSVLAAVVLGAAATGSLAVRTLAGTTFSWHEGAGIILLSTLAWTGDHWPAPVKGGRVMSLGAVAVACAAVMYGAAVASLLAAAAIGIELSCRRVHPLKVVFNIATYALMGGAAGLAAHVHPGSRLGIVASVLLAAGALVITNVGLVALMVSAGRRNEFARTARSILEVATLPFALSLSVVPVFVLAWRDDPYVAVLAIAPVAIVGLYFRSLEQSRKAVELGLTDPLTGLGNRRGFDERLDREFDYADATGESMSLCLFDVDRLKVINDQEGHARGDEVLVAVAGTLRHDGEAFRIGGDEFVLLLPGHNGDTAATVAAAIQARVCNLGLGMSVGKATYQSGNPPRADLLREADRELYAHKRSLTLR